MAIPDLNDIPETSGVVTLSAPDLSTFAEFLKWWSDITGDCNFQRIRIDITNLPRALHSVANEVITATGHSVEGGTMSYVPSNRNLVITETIFADIERRPDKLEAFCQYYALTLKSIAEQEWVAETTFVHVTHVSIDKEREIIRLAKLMNRLNLLAGFAILRLSLFEHPEGGYPTPKNGHIDRKYRPSIFDETPHRLFAKAFANLANPTLTQSDLFVRTSLDDDDLWLPWAIEEFVKIAAAIVKNGSRNNWCVGIPKQFLYYPLDLGRVDYTSMRMVMPGSKFNVSTSWEIISSRSSWMLPESFSRNTERHMRHRGVDIRLAWTARPCLVYVRRGGRLSAMTKFEHYRHDPVTVDHIGSEFWILDAARSIEAQEFAREPLEFGIDLPSPEARGKLDPGSGNLLISFNLREMEDVYPLSDGDYYVEIKCSTEDGVDRTFFPVAEKFEVDPSKWRGRALLLVHTKTEEEELFGTWVRGGEPYLS